MFIYMHWLKNGEQQSYAFHKEAKAVEFVLGYIAGLVDSAPAKKKKVKKTSPYFNDEGDEAPENAIPAPNPPFDIPAPAPRAARPVNRAVAPANLNPLFEIAPLLPDEQVVLAPDVIQPPAGNNIGEYVEYVGDAMSSKTSRKYVTTPKASDELSVLKNHLANSKPSLEDAMKAIEYYEAYSRYVINQESSIHMLKEIAISQ